MTSPSTAIAMLVRWREFGESLASSAYQQRSAQVIKAQHILNGAEATLTQVQRYQSTLQAAMHLDLTRLQIAAHIEDAAWHETEARSQELEDARTKQNEAQAAHVQARAQTRVATSRHDRIVASERDHIEKTMYDRMADMRTGTQRQSR